MKKLTMMLVLSMAILSGCATTQMTKLETKPDLAPPSDMSTLFIFRETYFGGAIVFWHYLDGKLIGETKAHDYFKTQVTPGSHYVVTATENATASYFDFKPGKSYFLGQGVAMGIWRARSSGFYPMTQEAALKAMNDCSYQEYTPKNGPVEMDPKLYAQAIEDYQKDLKVNPDGYKDILNYDGVVMK